MRFDKMHIAWIDHAKGIGMILVLLGHAILDSNNIIRISIYSFHMPLFFFLGGYVFRPKERGIKVLSSNAKSLLLPYALYIAAFSIYGLALNQKITLEQLSFLKGQTIWNDPLWFLVVLIEVRVAFSYVIGAIKGYVAKSAITAVLLLVGVAGGYLFSALSISDWFGVHKALIGLGFFSAGYLIKTYRIFVKNSHKVVLPLMYGVVWFSTGFIQTTSVGMYALVFPGGYWLFILRAMSGILLFIHLCFLIKPSKIADALSTLGRGSLFMMATHYFAMAYWWMLSDVVKGTVMYTILGMLFSVALSATYVALCKQVKAHAPILNGRAEDKSIRVMVQG